METDDPPDHPALEDHPVAVVVAVATVNGVGTVDRTGTEVVLLRAGDARAGDQETHLSHPEVRDRRVVTLSRCRTSTCR
jgi:hypothetical protein